MAVSDRQPETKRGRFEGEPLECGSPSAFDAMVTATKPYGHEQITASGHVIHWAKPSETRERAIPWMERAMQEGVHVLSCTVDTLSIAVVAGIQAWVQHEYHLCVRIDREAVKDHGTKKRWEHAACHGLKVKAVEVTLEV